MYRMSKYGWVKYFDYVILDILMLIISFLAAFFIRHGFTNPFLNSAYTELFVLLILLDVLLFVAFDSLQGILGRGYYREFLRTIQHAFLLLAFVFAVMFALQQGEDYSRLTIFGMLLIYIALSYSCRLVWKHLKKGRPAKNQSSLLIVTNSRLVENLLTTIQENETEDYQIIGVVFTDVNIAGVKVHGFPVVANIEDASQFIRQNWVDEVMVVLDRGANYPDDLIADCVNMGVTVHLNMATSKAVMGCKQVNGSVVGNLVTTYSLNMMTPFQAFLKRGCDIVGGLMGCAVTGILFLFLAPAIKTESPGPVFFKQTRIGLNGKPFTIYKFRSMYLDAEERKKELMAQNEMDGLMFKMAFDPRVIGNKIVDGKQKTGVGEFIRKHSLDEFPQFLNVLRGEMSIVGTRPPTEDEFKLYEARHRTRLATVPGLTGMWQISGRSEIKDFEEIVKMDTFYINNWSFGKDIRIVLQTIGMIFKPKGAA